VIFVPPLWRDLVKALFNMLSIVCGAGQKAVTSAPDSPPARRHLGAANDPTGINHSLTKFVDS
jgi:hypothetical protein